MKIPREGLSKPRLRSVTSPTSDEPRVLVVVPAWNEDETISTTIESIRNAGPASDILVVDDGSIDRTAEFASAAGVMVCRLPYNLGVGGAMRTGYRFALRGGYDIVAQIDADGQHDPRSLPALIAALEDADIAIGARFAGVGDYRASFQRRVAMRGLASTLSRLSGSHLTDVTSGLRVVNRRALTVFAYHYPAEYLGDTVESLVIAIRCGMRVTQVPVQMRPRAGGRASQSSATSVVYLARAAFALGLALIRRWPATAQPRPEGSA